MLLLYKFHICPFIFPEGGIVQKCAQECCEPKANQVLAMGSEVLINKIRRPEGKKHSKCVRLIKILHRQGSRSVIMQNLEKTVLHYV